MSKNISVILRSDVIASSPKRWEKQYADTTRPNQIAITEQLKALSAAGELTKAAVDKTIGNDSWTTLRCDQCNEDSEALACFQNEHDYHGKSICLSCILKAASSIRKELIP